MMRTAAAFVLALLLAPAASAQSIARLTLADAIAIAVQHNRTIDSARLAEDRADSDVAMARTRRLPVFSTDIQASRLLRPVHVTFPAGAFGTFPSIGPVPEVETRVTTPAGTNLVLNAGVSQPITGLIEAGLGVRLSQAARDLTREETRATRLAVVRQVKHAYYAIQENLSALVAAESNGRLLAELARVSSHRVSQRVALKADGLELQARLARAELTVITLRHAVASSKEQLNQLLGRDISTDFEVDTLPELASMAIDADSTDSIDDRPDVRQAQLRVQQSDLLVRRARADVLPEISLAVQLVSPVNIDGAPRGIASASLQLTWEPFDWGRRAGTVAMRRVDAARAAHARRETEEAAQVEINRYRRAVEQAQAALRVAALSQNAAREQVRVRSTQYQAEAALLSDVLQAQSAFAESTHQYHQALLSLLTARADLDHALGEDMVP